jgi:hypothetical protein
MRHTPCFLARRLRRSPSTPALAPESLRRRVLTSVRGEAHGPRGGSRARIGGARRGERRLSRSASPAVASAALVLIACAVAAALYFGVASLAPSSSERAVRSPHGLQASLRRFGARTELLVSGMSEPPIGEVYEVWLDRAGRAPQATDALFTVASDGKASVEVPGSLRGVREIAVTSEPLGGSTHPTSPTVLRVVLARRG